MSAGSLDAKIWNIIKKQKFEKSFTTAGTLTSAEKLVVQANMQVNEAVTVSTGSVVAGVSAVIGGTDALTLAGTGIAAAVYIGKQSAYSYKWPIGVYISGATAGILIAGAGTGAGLEMSGAFTGHMIYLHPTSIATGKRLLRLGDYGTEVPVAGGEGMIRSYAKITSGTDAVALDFYWGYVTTAATLIGCQRQYEVQTATPGPTAIYNVDLITGVAESKFIASGGDGLIGLRSKVYSNNGGNINGNVFALWVDHQINVAGPNGVEASIRGTTGGSKPDAFIYLETTSGGWSQLLQLASSMAAKEPFVATGCSVTVATVPYLKVLVDTTQYGIPLIAI